VVGKLATEFDTTDQHAMHSTSPTNLININISWIWKLIFRCHIVPSLKASLSPGVSIDAGVIVVGAISDFSKLGV